MSAKALVLPTEKSQPKDRISDYKWLIYGPPGIGKTTFANNFDCPLILDLEGGSNHLEVYRIPIADWNDIRAVHLLLKGGQHQFKTIVFDTADLLYRLCVTEVCTRRKIEHPSDEAWGKGADMVKNALYPMINAFQMLGLGIVFISHTSTKEIKTRTQVISKQTVSLPGSAANVLMPLCDIIGYCHFDEDTQSERMITFKGSDYLDAKARTSEAVNLPDKCKLNFDVIKSYFKGENHE